MFMYRYFYILEQKSDIDRKNVADIDFTLKYNLTIIM